MKVIHVPFSYHPDPVGGTEVYVEALARQQMREGMESLVAAPAHRPDAYRHRDISVRRFPVAEQVANIRELYGEGDALAAEGFAAILELENPDLIHLHAFTRGVSLALVRETKRRGIPVVFTYHTPTVSCQRGTLLRWGTEVCDGTLDHRTCTQCSLHGLGMKRALSTAAGWVPPQVGRLIGSTGRSGGLWTVLRMTELVTLRHAAFRDLMSEVDHVVAVCQWVKDLLRRNGAPDEKVSVSRQGLCQVEDDVRADQWESSSARLPLRLVFFGRLDPTKGLHVVIAALRATRDLPVTLDIYGVSQGDTGTAYLRHLQHQAGGDVRIAFKPPVSAEAVVACMRNYHAVAVPSQWLETGPLVVLEAFAARVPVIGSDLGGISELVNNGVDGLLVEAASVDAWRHTLERLCCDRNQLKALRAGVRPPRRMANVASDMRALYSEVLAGASLSHERVDARRKVS